MLGNRAEEVELAAPEEPLRAVDANRAMLAAPFEAMTVPGTRQVDGRMEGGTASLDRQGGVVRQARESGDVDTGKADEARILGQARNADLAGNIVAGVLMQDIPPKPVEPAAHLQQRARREGVGVRDGEVLTPIHSEAAESRYITVGVRVEGAGVA